MIEDAPRMTIKKMKSSLENAKKSSPKKNSSQQKCRALDFANGCTCPGSEIQVKICPL